MLENFLSERYLCSAGYGPFLCFCSATANGSDGCVEGNWSSSVCAWRLELISDKHKRCFLSEPAVCSPAQPMNTVKAKGTLHTSCSTSASPTWDLCDCFRGLAGVELSLAQLLQEDSSQQSWGRKTGSFKIGESEKKGSFTTEVIRNKLHRRGTISC